MLLLTAARPAIRLVFGSAIHEALCNQIEDHGDRGHPGGRGEAAPVDLRQQLNGSSALKPLGLGFRDTCFDGDLHSIFHRVFEGHLDSEQAVLVGRFGFVGFHRPT